jgi:hypothetical protein
MHRWRNNIKMVLREIKCEIMDPTVSRHVPAVGLGEHIKGSLSGPL